jgi:hypothetical protein
MAANVGKQESEGPAVNPLILAARHQTGGN